MAADCLITNGMVLSMDPLTGDVTDGAVLVTGGVIQAVGMSRDYSAVDAERVIDAGGGIILPGLVNCHTHLPMSLFKGMADDLPLQEWLNEHMFPAESTRINADTAYTWAHHAIDELLLAGTTTVCDGYFHEDRVAEAARDAGIRGVLAQGIIDFPAPGVPDPERNVAHAAGYVKQWTSRSSRLTPSLFCHSPYTCSAATLIQAKKEADAMGVLFQIHVAETRDEPLMIKEAGGRSPVEYLDSLGIIDSRTLLVHGVWLSEQDMDIIAARGAPVVHCPESNMKLASGIAPLQGLLERGVTVALGTDGSASNNDLDLFGEMASAMKLYRISGADPSFLDERKLVSMATKKGAEALGISHETGSLTCGKRADIIIVDTASPHLKTREDPFSALVYSVTGSDVSHVMVDGNLLVEKGKRVS